MTSHSAFLRHVLNAHSLLCWSLLSVRAIASPTPGAPPPGIETFTGSHTRVVWTIDAKNNNDTFSDSKNLQLVGFDSRDGRGQRILAGEFRNYYRPLITPAGSAVVFSDRLRNRIEILDWESGRVRVLKSDACAGEVWRDPATGLTWVYAQKDIKNPRTGIFRFRLDQPEIEEVVWNRGPIEFLKSGSFQVSGDGKQAAAAFPWPNVGVAQLPNVAWKKHKDGCWPSMAPDNSYMSWTFDGPHRNIILRRPGQEKSWKINLSDAPGVSNFEVYHPRWSNHVRYLVMTGPYTTGDKKLKLWEGGHGVELYIGRFNENFDRVEEWFRFTESIVGETFPDLWIAQGEAVASKFESETIALRAKDQDQNPIARLFGSPAAYPSKWPGNMDGLTFLWEDSKVSNSFPGPDKTDITVRLLPKGGARFGPNGEMHLVQGSFEPERDFMADLRSQFRNSDQFSIEAIVQTARSPQTGPARIISFSRNTSRRNFTLGQDGDQLVLRLQTTETNRNGADFHLSPLLPGQPHHILVTYKSGSLACYVDGKRVSETNLAAGDLDDWRAYELIFGSEHGNLRHWEGFIDGVAIYSRFIDSEEAKKKFTLAAERLSGREAIPETAVKAELLNHTPSPTPESIAPYRRALAVNRYRVRESSDPGLIGKEIQVAEWVLLDGQPPRSYRSETGMVIPLELQPFDKHPQLESERLVGETPSLDAPIYYWVSSGR